MGFKMRGSEPQTAEAESVHLTFSQPPLKKWYEFSHYFDSTTASHQRQLKERQI